MKYLSFGIISREVISGRPELAGIGRKPPPEFFPMRLHKKCVRVCVCVCVSVYTHTKEVVGDLFSTRILARILGRILEERPERGKSGNG